MRGVLPFLLLPALTFAQDVPSLQRPNPALPITESLDTLARRLGGPGGTFAAAQIALKPGGEPILQRAKKSKDPLVRLDATYGLSLLDTRSARLSLGYLIGDADPRVAGEAYVSLRRARGRAVDELREVALRGNEQAGNTAIYLLDGPESESIVLQIAKTVSSAGREAALTRIRYSASSDIRLFEAAAHDPRLGVGSVAARYFLYDRKTGLAKAALNRLIHSSDIAPRLALASTLASDYSSANWEVMVALLRDRSPEVRLKLADVLIDNLFGSGRVMATLPYVARLANDPVPAVADRAIQRLGDYAQDRIAQRESLGWTASPAASLLNRGAARRLQGPLAFPSAIVLALLQDRRAYPVLLQRARDGEDRREVAIMALGMLGDRRATPLLMSLTDHPNYSGNAFAALGFLRDPSTIPFLLKLVREHPRDDGILAAYALGQMGNPWPGRASSLSPATQRSRSGTD